MKKFKTLNLIDLTVVIIVFGLAILFATSYQPKKAIVSEQIDLILRVTSDKSMEKAAKEQKTVYFDSVKEPAKVKNVSNVGADLFITIEAPGKIENGRYIFNGRRVLIGQKGEIHSTYFAQGIITDVVKAN